MQVKDMEQVFDDLRMQGLENHVAELEIQGYTTIKQVLSAETVTRAKSAIISRVEKQTAKKVDLESGAGFEGQTYIPYMLYDDEVFENILLEARPLALITYLLGESALLSSMGCHFKGPGGDPLVLHSDNGNGIDIPNIALAPRFDLFEVPENVYEREFVTIKSWLFCMNFYLV